MTYILLTININITPAGLAAYGAANARIVYFLFIIVPIFPPPPPATETKLPKRGASSVSASIPGGKEEGVSYK